jgi:hypothetical protein
MAETYVLKTQKQFNDFFETHFDKSSEEVRKIVIDGIIPSSIREEGQSYQLWKTDAQRIFEGREPRILKIYSLLLRFFTPLSRIPENSYVTLHIRNTLFPIQMIRDLNLETRVGTLRYEFTEDSTVGAYSIRYPDSPLPLERLIMDYGSYVDCTRLTVPNLVLYSILCGGNMDKAKEIQTLVIVHPFNILPDGEIFIPSSQKKFVGQKNGFPLPSPPGMIRLVIPEAQEFRYDVRETVLPDIIGIIPSGTYPSRMAFGIKSSRHPFERSRLPEEVLDLYNNPPEDMISHP